jgi:hypothetical protein
MYISVGPVQTPGRRGGSRLDRSAGADRPQCHNRHELAKRMTKRPTLGDTRSNTDDLASMSDSVSDCTNAAFYA